MFYTYVQKQVYTPAPFTLRQVYTALILSAIQRQGKDHALPGAESMNDVAARVKQWTDNDLKLQIATTESSRTFAFAHRFTIACLASAVKGWGQQTTFEADIPYLSHSRFSLESRSWQLDCLGQTEI